MSCWKELPLATACSVFADGDWIETKDQAPSGIRLIQTGNIGVGEFKDRKEKARYIGEGTFARLKCREIFEGDCVVSRLPDPVGRACIVPYTGERMITAVDCTIIRFKETSVDPQFFNYYARSHKYIAGVDAACTGATRQRISRKNLGKVPIPAPPLSVQKRIVAILDEAFAGIAAAIANAEKNLANARELFESYLNSIFAQQSEGAERSPLVDLCERNRMITYGVIKLGTDIPDGVPCLRTSNVRWLHIDIDGMKRIAPSLSTGYKRTILRGGEVLVNVRGTLGGVAVATSEMSGWNVSREVAVVPRDTKKVDSAYLAYWIGTRASQQWLAGVQKGVAYTGINIADLRTLPVPVPRMEEQIQLVERLDNLSAESRRLNAIYLRKLIDLAELKQSILQKAFAGELTSKPERVLKEALV